MCNRPPLRQHGACSRPSRNNALTRVHGFALIELVIALAIVAILAAIAFPSYQAQVRSSARAEAQSFITNAAARQQQFLIDRRSYAVSLAQLGMPAPANLASKYTFGVAVTDGPPPTYRFTATAIGTQASDKCAGVDASVMTLDNAGNRTPANCW